MKFSQLTRSGLVALATFGTFVPAYAVGPGPQARPVNSAALVSDIALRDGGVLSGQVVDQAGQAAPGAVVVIESNGQPVAEVVAGPQGQFEVSGLRSGAHLIRTAENVKAVRLWAAQTAPPVAAQDLLLVGNGAIQRGQNGRGGFLGRAFANYPILTAAGLLGAGIGSGIAIGYNIDSSGS